MKNIIIVGFIVLASFQSPRLLRAQGTMTYLSNLGQPSTGTNAVGSDSWLATLFITGTNSIGYTLNSIQLGMAHASGNPSGFTVMIYTSIIGNAILPGSSLGTLNGSLNPTTAGIFTYTPASNLTLSPSTIYYIVLTAGTAVANGTYEWTFMNIASYNPSAGWGGGVTLSSVDGSSWFRLGSNPNYDYSQFAINATAIPEPGVLGLLGLGGLGFLWYRRKAKAL
jgi:hypothetical protein